MKAIAFLLVAAPLAAAQPADLGAPFRAWGATGAFYLVDRAADTALCYGLAGCDERTIPASTSKLFNALLALEAGVVAPEDTVRWDGTDHGSPGWNRDQTLRTALQRSAVWVFEDLVRRVGPERTAAVYAREAYGNARTDTTTFWLHGPHGISPREQVAFLERLHDRTLGFPRAAMDSVVAWAELERGAHPDGTPWVLRGKTGWGFVGEEQIGWLVGWVERAAGPAFFALRLRVPRERDFPMREARPAVLRALLDAAGGLPAE